MNWQKRCSREEMAFAVEHSDFKRNAAAMQSLAAVSQAAFATGAAISKPSTRASSRTSPRSARILRAR